MYEQFFELETRPFMIQPDPEFIFWSPNHIKAATVLDYGVLTLAPIALITGEVGSGKTTLIQEFVRKDPEDLTIGIISNFTSGTESIYQWILLAFEQDFALASDSELIDRITHFFISEYADGRRCALIIDEAQSLSEADLERLRLLTNINRGKDVVVLLVLVGQPELKDRLSDQKYHNLVQRIGACYHLSGLTPDDTNAYIRHRIRIAGGTDPIFTDTAIDEIYRYTCGIPRVINVLCDLAMVSAYGEQRRSIDAGFMVDVIVSAREQGYLIAEPLPAEKRAVAGSSDVIVFWEEAVRLKQSPTRDDGPLQPGLDLAFLTPPSAPETPKPVIAQPAVKIVPQVDPVQTSTTDAELSITPSSDFESDATPTKTRRFAMMAVAVVLAGTVMMVPDALETGRALRVDAAVPVRAVQAQAFPTADSKTPRVDIADGFDRALIQSALIETSGDGDARLAHALDVALVDPSAAAIGFASAALAGNDRAAYYLGQMYETGDGVPLSVAMAQTWYESVKQSVRGARRRLTDLPAAIETQGAPRVSLLVADGRSAEYVDLIWSSTEAATFTVSLATSAGEVLKTAQTPLTALRVNMPADAALWTVSAGVGDSPRWQKILKVDQDLLLQ